MSRQSGLWSINSLAHELNKDRRTVTKRLKGVSPDGVENGHPAWKLERAVKAILAAGKPEILYEVPDIYGFMEKIPNPIHQGFALAAHLFVQHLPKILEGFPEAFDLKGRRVPECKASLVLKSIEFFQEMGEECNIEPFATMYDPDMWVISEIPGLRGE